MVGRETDRSSSIAVGVFVAAVTMSAGMLVFEILKPLVAPGLRPWPGRIATVAFATVLAVAVSWSLARRGARVNEALRVSCDSYADLIENFPNLIWRGSTDRGVDYFNQAWFDFTGRLPNQELGEGWKKGIHPDDLAEYLLNRRIAFIRKEPLKSGYRLRRNDDAYRWIVEYAWPIEDGNGHFLGLMGVCSDVSEVKEQSQKLEHLSTHDPLTGLPNRRSLERALDMQVSRSARTVPGALLYMDVDNFKGCNDTRGHEFGDVILMGVAEVLRRNARKEELVARLGGDEFAVILERATTRTAKFVADRMRDGVRKFAAVHQVDLDLSVGVAIIDGKSTSGRVLREADAAMYEAKQAGKGRTAVSSIGSKKATA